MSRGALYPRHQAAEFSSWAKNADDAYGDMLLRLVNRVRRRLSGTWWHQWIIVLIGIVVVAAMVLIAGSARGDAERHRQVQVLVERVRASSQQIDAITWEGLTDSFVSPQRPLAVDPTLVSRGFAAWGSLSATLNSLRSADAGGQTATLERDAGALYRAGLQAFTTFTSGDNKLTLQMEQTRVRPALAVLETDSERASHVQQKVADQASRRSGLAYLGSLVVGLVLLVLLGWRLHRLQRRALIADERRASERRSEKRVRALVEHASDAISVIGRDLSISWQSSSIERMLGHESQGLIGRRLTELVHPEDAPRMERQLAAGMRRPGTVTFGARFRHAEGDWRHLETIAENRLADPAVGGVVLSARDVTGRKAFEDELRHQAFHDALTGLANRALFEDRLAHALSGARRRGRAVGVLFLDLDDFKTINDSLGHASGDDLLRAVALRISAVLRSVDTAARMGGDEFAVLVEAMDDDNEAEVIAGRIFEELRPAFRIRGRDLTVTASAGLAMSDGALGLDELLRNADTAMYAAKERGKGTLQVFEQGMHRRVLERLELTGQLRRALEHGEFRLAYQPIVELESGRIVGTEALVRWAHPRRGVLAPGAFIALAEETGLIVPIGNWVLQSACAQAGRWHRALPGGPPIHVNVNVSTRQLYESGFPEIVAEALRSSGLDPRGLILEITESLLADDSDALIRRLENLKALGVRLAVDDFGTGYSALSRLRRFPIDILKIDRSFISGIGRDAGKAQLVRGIVNLGESLNLEVVAEGIEEHEEAGELRAMSLRFGQGYLFSRPVDGEKMWTLLRDRASLRAMQRVVSEPN
jgi:diguanylate cyclase (GGDEF)-like protein/PAS domain S-box-containing protein